MTDPDIRWKQRFQNLEKAYARLRDAVAMKNLSDLEKAGVIQVYEFTFELAWKTVKDYLEANEVLVSFPRDVIKAGFKYDLLDGELWLDMLQKRNLMSHSYDEENAELAYRLIVTKYFVAIEELFQKLQQSI
ncbi:nucleotidyltransferase substrate binding protein [Persicitalea jodogahamensis]|uniref:Nucleotidyltransferase n=1 Tax=Persicitalea jodogahamensis TaxID=402147 RepID=A0A8J3G7G0_9BACT|nr:nucleotidyltransferase substrate binding protein [Persicitalea jodogahamensis]GHB54940.1 nucleotidyltransferase [Persicitalea jodogahamensis]